MPPPGGYETIKYKRSLPTRGPGGIAIFGAVIGICAFGFWRLGEGNLERRCVPPFKDTESRGRGANSRTGN